MLLKTQYIATASTLVVLFLVGAAVVYHQTREVSQTVSQAAVATVVQPTPALVSEQYQVGLRVVTEKLSPLLDKQLSATDQATLTAVRDQLVTLIVPPQAQTYHLQLVLKISLLAELLTPGKVTVAAHDVAALTSTQTELKQVLANSPRLTQ